MAMLRLISFVGLLAFVALAWLLSTNHKKINWRIIVGGLSLQIVFALIVFSSRSITFNGRFEDGVLFYAVNSFFMEINRFVTEGSGFMFNINPHSPDEAAQLPPRFALLRTFAFGVLPTVVFFSALMSVLYHVGVMQKVVKAMAWVMQRTLRTSGAESLGAAANVFLGHTEAPLVVRPFIPTMTASELNALMVGGFATISGGLMAAYVGMGINAGHLLTASVISAPAALLVAKLLVPETGTPDTLGDVKMKDERNSVNVIDAAATGASEGMKLAINIAAMLIAFLALIAMADAALGYVGETIEWIVNAFTRETDYDFQWSLSGLFGVLFFPFALLMGVQWNDAFKCGELLGTKLVINEFIAYDALGQVMPGKSSYPPGVSALSERSAMIMTYALSGFSNFGAIAIQIGGIGGLAPNRKSDLARLGLRAMIGGMIACCMTACVAGMIL